MFRLNFPPLRDFFATTDSGIRTSRVESASGRGIHRTWNISLKYDSPARPAYLRIGNGNSGKERLRIRMQRIFMQYAAFGKLYNISKIHNADSV